MSVQDQMQVQREFTLLTFIPHGIFNYFVFSGKHTNIHTLIASSFKQLRKLARISLMGQLSFLRRFQVPPTAAQARPLPSRCRNVSESRSQLQKKQMPHLQKTRIYTNGSKLIVFILVSQAMGAVEEPGIPCIYISNVERKMGKTLLRKTLMLWNAYLRRNGILRTETLDNHVLNLNVLPM